jgi:hypothetical protein
MAITKTEFHINATGHILALGIPEDVYMRGVHKPLVSYKGELKLSAKSSLLVCGDGWGFRNAKYFVIRPSYSCISALNDRSDE